MQKSKTNETLKNRILVIGGYGMVGRRICKELGRRYPGRVFAVGRDLKKATDFSATTTGAVGPLRFDMHGDETPERLLKNAQLVIMCLDQSDSRFLEACILGRVTYIDITASADFHRMAERLGNVAKHIETTAILSVGLAPGLTNLLVKYITAEFDEIDDANIAILLGLGDRHGRAAVEWTVDNLHGDYEVLGRNGGTKRVQALSEGRRVTFPGIGMRTAYRFNFSDQHILPRTLSIPSVTSRLCFDSEIVGRLLAFLKRVGALALLRRPWIRRLTVQAFEKIKFGSDVYALRIDATGSVAGVRSTRTGAVTGRCEADATAAVAAAIARRTLEHPLPAGVFHSEQLFELEELLPEIETQISFISGSGLQDDRSP